MGRMSLKRTGFSVSRFCVMLLCALAAPLFSPATGSCLPPGGGSYSLMDRYTDQEGATVTGTLNESLLRLDLFQTVPGYGRLFLSTDLSRTDPSDTESTTSLSRYQLGMEGFRLGRWTSSLLTGDTSVRFTSHEEGFVGPAPSLLFTKPYLAPTFTTESGRFLNATYPDINFRGGLLNSQTDRDNLLLFGGRLSNIRGFQANEVEVTDESLVGAKWTHKWTSGTYAGAGFIRTTNQQWQAGNPAGLTIDNSIFLLDGSCDLGNHLRLVGEYRQNFFTLNGTATNDWAIKTGPMIFFPNGRLELNYRRVGPNYQFVGENLQAERDVEGVFASLDYKAHQHLSIYSSFDWNRSNLANSTAIPAVDTLTALIGGYFSHPILPSLNLRFSLTDRSSRVPLPTLVESRDYSLYVEILKAFKLATPYLRLQGELLNDSASPLSSAKTGTATVGVRLTPLSMLNLYIEGEEQVRNADIGPTTTAYRTTGGLSYTPLQNLSIHADCELSTIKDDSSAGTSQKNQSFNGGVMIALPRQYYVSSDVRYGSSRLDAARSTEASTLQFTINLTKRFGWGRAGGGLISGQGSGVALADVGDIEGFVYQDLNRNGKRDTGEPGLARVTVLLEDNRKVVTDREGRYRFSDVVAGIHVVKLNERELDANINLLANANQRVEVKLRETTRVDYPVSYSGSMKGMVLIDTNGNGTADPADTPLPDILVYLADSNINTFSDTDGNFALENLLPGRYEVRIDTTGLSAGMKLVTPDRYTVEIKSGEELKDIIFLIATEKKEIRKKVFGTGGATVPGTTLPAKEKKESSVQKGETVRQAAATAVKAQKMKATREYRQKNPAKNAVNSATAPAFNARDTNSAAAPLTIPPTAASLLKPVGAGETGVVEVHFRQGSVQLASGEDMASLLTVAKMFNSLQDMQVAIEGRADQTGSASRNRELGLKRAEAVARILIKSGVPREKIVRIRSFGHYGLFCEELTKTCRAKNRRVVIRFFK
ncbi:MAG: hypothetical protein CXR31_03765 [Geobacter sp.]|nr:MAG: hypothetical protein CXR31_03765 [Geobacter sp.]